MALSFVTYTGDGNTTAFNLTFPYINKTDVTVLVNEVNTSFTWLSSSQVSISPAPANLASIKIQRSTNNTSMEVDFVDSAILTEADLDKANQQNFYLSQEAKDDADISLKQNPTGNWDGENKILQNLVTPVAATDGATKGYIDTQTNNAFTSATNAATSEANAATSEANAATSYDNFDDRFLGAKDTSSGFPTVDNDNDVLVDGCLLFSTTENVMFVFDLGNTTWVRTIPTVSDQAKINTVSGIASDVTAVSGKATEIGRLGTADAVADLAIVGSADFVSDLNTVASADFVSDLNTVASADFVSDLNTLATTDVVNDMNVLGTSGNVTNMNTLGTAGNVTAMANCSGSIANINTTATNISSITTTANNIADINTLSGIATDVSSLATKTTEIGLIGTSTNMSSITNVSSNLSSINSFANTYKISSSAPTTDLDVGDLYFDTTANELKVYKTSGWAAAGSTVNGTSARFTYNISGTPTSVTGTDVNGNTLAYDAGYADVYLNGVRLSSADITITSGTSVVFASALANGDVVDIVAYGTFNVATISASNVNSGTLGTDRLPTIPVAKGGTGLTALGAADTVLKVNTAGNALEYGTASSPEVYGFNVDSTGNLIVTTTNKGADNISEATYATFDDVVYASSDMSWSLSGTNLRCTI
jgi:hypothetical protein